jgi:hypothetical protein
MSSQAQLTKLQYKIGNIDESYEELSQIYFLPERNSKAINKDYLDKYYIFNQNQPSIFMLKRSEMTMIKPMPFNSELNAMDLLNKLKELLKLRKLPDPGMTINTLPDMNWFGVVFRHLDPNDNFKVFVKSISYQDTIMRSVNPE